MSKGTRTWATTLAGIIQQINDVGFDALPSYSCQELRDKQLEDEHLRRVMCYVDRKSRPSRHERMEDPSAVRKFMKQWDKLLLKDGVLYNVSNNPT